MGNFIKKRHFAHPNILFAHPSSCHFWLNLWSEGTFMFSKDLNHYHHHATSTCSTLECVKQQYLLWPLKLKTIHRWLVKQERCNSSMLARELHLSCTNPSKCKQKLVGKMKVLGDLSQNLTRSFSRALLISFVNCLILNLTKTWYTVISLGPRHAPYAHHMKLWRIGLSLCAFSRRNRLS